jgi:tRNA(Ile)-lysidine synthase
MIDKAFLARLRGEFSVRRKYLVGVSGGRDSVVLVDCLLAAGITKLVVCHLDHGLRGRASTGDARFVGRMAERLRLPCVSEKMNVGALAKQQGLSLETAARCARRSFFAKTAREQRCDRVFLAHHADDQAETVLMNIARGCGLSGLAGMRRASEHKIDGRSLMLLRPLLAVKRAQIDRWIASRGLRYREDASNADPQVGVRNAVRQELLPMMDQLFGREVAVSLVRLAQTAAEDEALIEAEFAKVLAMTGDETLPVKTMTEMPEALRRRVILRWLRARGVSGCGVAEVRRVLSLLEEPLEETPAKVNLPSGWFARRCAGVLFLER